jgi:hypothetical protein
VDVVPAGVAGLNVPVTPAGAPSRASVTGSAKLVRVSVTVACPCAPCATDTGDGATARV